MVIQYSLLAYRGGQFRVSPEGQFAVSPDNTELRPEIKRVRDENYQVYGGPQGVASAEARGLRAGALHGGAPPSRALLRNILPGNG